ncbi:hypothetical protein NDU88_002000 [Pleurodeles waltl]|uniref:Uncharacterized protein n=1 Tax=Pleurodeles waltl TaxID=8319 RepID=A0AAV7LBC2_PLEWA|nr:hypothetical protein NDU88_002000 [Pleurodeles waltl]
MKTTEEKENEKLKLKTVALADECSALSTWKEERQQNRMQFWTNLRNVEKTLQEWKLASKVQDDTLRKIMFQIQELEELEMESLLIIQTMQEKEKDLMYQLTHPKQEPVLKSVGTSRSLQLIKINSLMYEIFQTLQRCVEQ